MNGLSGARALAQGSIVSLRASERLAGLSLRQRHHSMPVWLLVPCVELSAMMTGYCASSAMSASDASQRMPIACFVGLAALYVALARSDTTYPESVFEGFKRGVRRAILYVFVPAYLLVLLARSAGVAPERFGWGLGWTVPFIGLALMLTSLAFGALAGGGRIGRSRRPDLLIFVDGSAIIQPPPDAVMIDVEAAGFRVDVSDPATLGQLGQMVAGMKRVVVACSTERRSSWAAALKGANVEAEIIAEEIGALRPLGTGAFQGRATIKVSTGPLSLRDRGLKRVFDILIGAIALLALLPVFLLVAAAIKIDSKGPIFFRQKRIGRGNQTFFMHKFRSMRVDRADADGNQLTQGRHDARITRVGGFLRRSSLDELPQLIDVVLGRMSIVGPRPHALGAKAGDLLYWEVDQAYWHRHSVKPGMTGLAQVRGFRGTTFVPQDLIDRLRSDLEYLSGWSLSRDVAILFSTVRVLVGSKAF